MRKFFLNTMIGAALVLSVSGAAAEPKKSFKVGWSIYVGWMPWGYAADTGIVKKWADKYGISIEVKQFNDYADLINQYTAGAFDAATITSMDTLSTPSAAGVDSTAMIVGDFSNGNDAILLKNRAKLADIRGQKINLVEASVSEYLLARALEGVKMSEKDIKIVNTSDADMAAACKTADVSAVVTWNPIVSEVLGNKDAHKVFDSSQLPGEIMDLMVANTAVLKDNPNFGKALIGIWYETLGEMLAKNAMGKAAKEAMAKASGADLASFDAQLASARLFVTPQEAAAFAQSKEIATTMDHLRAFLFDKSLLGKDARSADAVGVELADKKIVGDPKNVKFRFDPTFMTMAAQGKL